MPAAHLRQGPTAQPLAAPPNQTTCGAPTPPHPPSTHARTHACRTAHWSPHTVSRNAHPHRTNSRQGGGRSCAASLSFFDEGRGGAGGGEEGFPLAQQPLLQSAPAPPSEFAALSLGEVFAAAKASTDPVRTRYTCCASMARPRTGRRCGPDCSTSSQALRSLAWPKGPAVAPPEAQACRVRSTRRAWCRCALEHLMTLLRPQGGMHQPRTPSLRRVPPTHSRAAAAPTPSLVLAHASNSSTLALPPSVSSLL